MEPLFELFLQISFASDMLGLSTFCDHIFTIYDAGSRGATTISRRRRFAPAPFGEITVIA